MRTLPQPRADCYACTPVCHATANRRLFSVHVGEAIESTQRESLERMARYLTRSPVVLGKVLEQRDGRVKLLTPRDPKTGLDHRFFAPHDWVHAVATTGRGRALCTCPGPLQSLSSDRQRGRAPPLWRRAGANRLPPGPTVPSAQVPGQRLLPGGYNPAHDSTPD